MPSSTQKLTARIAAVCAAGVAVISAAVAWAGQQTPSSPAPFTAEQADAGRRAYSASCAACHAGDLGGGAEAPELAGANFASAWRDRTTKDLISTVQGMPPDGARLPAAEYLAIAAYILQQNGAQAGSAPLTEAAAVTIGTIANGTRPPR
jgi:mono/diheme cytochrome c family protein